MDIYMVGGAVRDTLLGLPVKDHDWVVVGATPQDMLDQGFLPVGKDFPVFLHPRSRQEYALARTERKTAPGYRGFAIHAAPDVTLQQDLARRDLTINAMAVPAASVCADGSFDPAHAALVDPFHGQRDLQGRVLRHVGDAFREDPVRILRVARFAARFADFHVAPETLVLMQAMVAHGEVEHLVAERVWQELARGLMEARPSRLVEQLEACGALERLWPGLPAPADAGSDHARWLTVLDASARVQASLPVRFACLCLPLEKPDGITAHCQRLRVPRDCADLAVLAAREYAMVTRSAGMDAEAVVGLLERSDAFRKPARFHDLLRVCALWDNPQAAYGGTAEAPDIRLRAALAAARSVDTEITAAQALAAGAAGPQVGAAIRAARHAAVAAALSN